MRIIASADIHGSLDVYNWLADQVVMTRCDLMILAGDLLSGGWEQEQRAEADQIILPLLEQIACPILYIMGNDDHVSLELGSNRIQPIHASRVEFEGCSVVGYQYSPPFIGGIFEKPEEQITDDLVGIEKLVDENTVLVTHSPARGILDVTSLGARVGSVALARLLQRKPVLAHIHGHVHQSFGRERNRFNVAAAARRRAMVIDLPDLKSRVIN